MRQERTSWLALVNRPHRNGSVSHHVKCLAATSVAISECARAEETDVEDLVGRNARRALRHYGGSPCGSVRDRDATNMDRFDHRSGNDDNCCRLQQ
jgi:hypothetical protein